MPRRRVRRKQRLDPRAAMPRWQFELTIRGEKKEGVWWWPYTAVVSYCKRPSWVSNYLRSNMAHNVVYYQVYLYALTGVYIHHTRRNGEDEFFNIDYSGMTGYKNVEMARASILVRRGLTGFARVDPIL